MTNTTSSKYLIRAALNAVILAELGAQSVAGLGLTTATLQQASGAGLLPTAKDGALGSKASQRSCNGGPACSGKLGTSIARQVTTCEAATIGECESSPTASGEDNQDEQGSDQPDGEQYGKGFVGFTSRLVAVSRAIESGREDRLFNDPYAERLAGPVAMELIGGGKRPREGVVRGSSNTPSDSKSGAGYLMDEKVLDFLRDIQASRSVSLRTRYGDDYFEDCTMSRGIKQVVLLGAGMDTRGLRLKAQENTKVFEVDQAMVLNLKRELLSTPGPDVQAGDDCTGRATVIGVEVDLSIDGWQENLVNAGFDPSLPSAWIAEGLTTYLEEDPLKSLLSVVGDLCAPGSALCVSFADKEIAFKGVSLGSEFMSAWKFDTADPEGFMRDLFSDSWSFTSASYNKPGGYPHGGNYGIECSRPSETYVIGFS